MDQYLSWPSADAGLGHLAGSASAFLPSLWQLAAFWLAASLTVYASQRLSEYVSLSVDQASRRVFESFASLGMGCIFWALVMVIVYLRVDIQLHEWTLLPALSALVVMVLSCRLALPTLLTRRDWSLRVLASAGMSAGLLLGYSILVTNCFSLASKTHVLPFALASVVLAALVMFRSWRHQQLRLRLRATASPHADNWIEWGVCGGVVVALQWLLSISFDYSQDFNALGASSLDESAALIVVGIFAGAISLEQLTNIRADRGRQQLVHRGLSMIRSSADSAVVQSDARLALIADYLHELLRPERLALHFQPIVNLRSQSVHLEALLRLEHPLLGRINPEKFFLVCELRGKTQQADRLIVLNALAHARQWHESGHALAIHVNIAPVTLMAGGFCEWLLAEIAQRGLSPQHVRLELTEHAITANGRSIDHSVRELHARGIQVIMDDFGAGFSSLGLLANLPLASIKCDRLFLRDVENDVKRQILLRHVAAMAHDLGLLATVEGVETEAELRSVVRCGIESIQGYLFARPLPAAQIPHWLQHACPERLQAMRAILDSEG